MARGAGASAGAVGAVALLIVVLLAWQGRQSGADDGVRTGSPLVASSTSASQSPVSTPVPSSVSTPTATPDVTSSPSTSSTPSTSGTPSTTASPSVSVSPAGARLPVVILNQSSRTGLASRTASLLRTRGWRVASVGNSHGSVPSTTVYAPAGAADQAAQVAALLPGADRVRPVTGSMSTSRLTVVLTASYPG